MSTYDLSSTICAISSPPGRGAIALVRISGSEAIATAAKFIGGRDLQKQPANSLQFGRFEVGGRLIDEVVVSVFRSPASYTGEDLVEISCHGSPYIQSEVLKALISGGARLAREGEFTMRAFLNEKLDLSQAEAVGDLIASDSRASHELAMVQLRGGYSSRLAELRSKLVDFCALLELELDFSEEDVKFADRNELVKLGGSIMEEIAVLVRSFDTGNAIKKGIPVAITGEPNVGKSTLLNRILQEEKSIVSEIPGTTRDFIEDVISLGGISFRFIDTAGLRETEDSIEKLGIERTLKKREEARVILRLHDARKVDGAIRGSKDGAAGGKLFLDVINKMDYLGKEEGAALRKGLAGTGAHFISASRGEGVEELLDSIVSFVTKALNSGEGVVVSSARHYGALQKSAAAMERVLKSLSEGISTELIAQDIREALHYLGEITGQVSNEDVLGSIFSKFCIGK